MAARFIRYMIDHAGGNLAPLTGKTLYAVAESGAYNTDNPLTEHGSKDGYYYNAGLAYGSWDIWDSVGPTKLEDAVLHGVETNGVLSTHIGAGQVGSSEIANGAVTSNELADDSVTAAKLATNSVTADAIAAAAVGQSEIASNAVGSNEIQADAVNDTHIADNSIKTEHYAAGSVDQSAIGSGAVGVGELQDGVVGTVKLGDGAVTGVKIATSTITNDKFVAAIITEPYLADRAATGIKIALDSISNAHLKQDSVAAFNIQAGAINASLMADYSVGTNSLIDGAVTFAKMANNSVGGSAILTGAVTDTHLANKTVTGASIADDTIGLAHITPSFQTWIENNAGAGGSVTNQPDDVSIEENGSNQLQIKALGVALSMLAQSVQDELTSRSVVYVAASDSSAEHKLQAGSNVCDGTDDELVITPLCASNTTVILLPGTYNIDEGTPTSATVAGCIHVESLSKFALIGMKGAVLKKESTVTSAYAVKLFECSDCYVEVEIDGNKAAATGGGVQAANCDRVIISECNIYSLTTHAIAIHSTRDAVVKYNFVRDLNAGHAIDFNDDEDDNPDVLNQRVLVTGNNVDLTSGGGFDTCKVEDGQYLIISNNIFRSYSGASNLVVGGDSGDEANSTAWVAIYGNTFIGGDTSLFNLRFGSVRVWGNQFLQTKMQVGGGGGGDVIFKDNYVEQPDVNSAFVIFAGETSGHTTWITDNEFMAPDTGTESKTISFDWNTGTPTDYNVYFERNYVHNFRALGLEVNDQVAFKPVIKNNLFRPSSNASGAKKGVDIQNTGGAVLVENTFENCIQSILLTNTTWCDVRGNNINPHASATSGIEEIGTSNWNRIKDTFFQGSGLGRNEYYKILGANTKVSDSWGAENALTELTGTVQITSGNTTVTLDLGQDMASTVINDIKFSFVGSPGSARTVWGVYQDVDDITVTVDQDPGATITIRYEATNLAAHFA